MRIAYLDCFAGISGDMFLGALIDAGVPHQVLDDAVVALGVDASLTIERVNRSGIASTKVYVLENGLPAEQKLPHHSHGSDHHEHAHQEIQAPHTHVHGRSLNAIRNLIQAAPLHKSVKEMAIHTFETLGNSEATIHNVRVEDIHFHEVGAVDAIADIVAACAGIHFMEIEQWYCSPLNVGAGMVTCAHGTFPVPAPATADLLRGLPTYSAHVQMELVTPTGAALIRMLSPLFSQQPAMKANQIGYGAGSRNPKNFPNVLRLSIGDTFSHDDSEVPSHASDAHVTVLETALDDISPQILAYVAESALAKGALDVMLTPVIMKKGRPGTLLTVLCNETETLALQHLILSETSTLGIRIRRDRRICLDRHHSTVQTEFGDIRMKVGSFLGEELNTAPEFEDCRLAALRDNVPVKRVQQAAITAYRSKFAKEKQDL